MRRRIAAEAARLLARGGDAERARYRAARRVAGGWVPPDQVPGPDEVRRELHRGASSGHEFASLTGDRFDRIAALVAPLAALRQDPARHPEGDVLEHSLQAFDIVRGERPFDEELLTAALVHDVGRGIDRGDPVAAGLAALEGLLTPRTHWLVENLPVARAYRDGSLGHRARRRLESHECFLDALLLADADRDARVRGYDTPSLEAAIAALRALADDGTEDGAAINAV
ncbi:MAG: hypothetical protein EBR28_13000 [Planctomycetia bacterium]|nr:hypothetical protein [Planctomycetia bacterium]